MVHMGKCTRLESCHIVITGEQRFELSRADTVKCAPVARPFGRPLTVIFHGKVSASIRRTDLSRLDRHGVKASRSRQRVRVVPWAYGGLRAPTRPFTCFCGHRPCWSRRVRSALANACPRDGQRAGARLRPVSQLVDPRKPWPTVPVSPQCPVRHRPAYRSPDRSRCLGSAASSQRVPGRSEGRTNRHPEV